MKVRVEFNGNLFAVEGDFPFDDIQIAYTQFLDRSGAHASQLQALADQLNSQSDQLQTAVDANTSRLKKE